jgi:cytochrome P450
MSVRGLEFEMAKTVPVASRMPESSESTEPELPMARSAVLDPPSRLSALREQQPICRLAYQDGHLGWLVTSHALTRAVLADPRFSRRRELQHLPKGFPQFPTTRGTGGS